MKRNLYQNISDAELLTRFYKDNDQQWIGILLERYTLLLLGVCMKYLKNEEEAKDCVQQIFLKVLQEVPKYRIDYFKSWLYMVAKNHSLMKLRASGGKETKELTDLHSLPEENQSKKEHLENEKTYALLEESMNELNDEQRQCVTLFYLHKNSYSQISEKTGFSVMQVKSHIQNGKRNLKLMLERKLKQNKAL